MATFYCFGYTNYVAKKFISYKVFSDKSSREKGWHSVPVRFLLTQYG